VSADESGFGELIIMEEEAALEGGAASLADDSMDVNCAGNSGVRSVCLLTLLVGCDNGVPRNVAGSEDIPDMFMCEGSEGVAKLLYD
jgi:hypothetical protein